MKLVSIRLMTSDVSALAAFYTAITGLDSQGDGNYCEVRTLGCTIAITDKRLVEKLYPGHFAVSANRSVILEFQVEDVDDLREKLSGIVSDWVQEPTTMPWGNRSMLFRDPDGNMINIYAKVPAADQARARDSMAEPRRAAASPSLLN